MNLPEVEAVKLVRVEPGDVVFVKVGRIVSKDEIVSLRDMIKPLFPDNEVVVGCDADIEIVRAS